MPHVLREVLSEFPTQNLPAEGSVLCWPPARLIPRSYKETEP